MWNEVENLLRIRDSEFKRNMFKTDIGGSKIAFERICEYKSGNKEFKKWFDSLISDGCLEPFKFVRGNWTYMVNEKKIRNKLFKLPLYKLFGKFYQDFLP